MSAESQPTRVPASNGQNVVRESPSMDLSMGFHLDKCIFPNKKIKSFLLAEEHISFKKIVYRQTFILNIHVCINTHEFDVEGNASQTLMQ